MSRPATLRSAGELAAEKPHGTRIRYMGGCKCMLCRAANSNYEMRRMLERLKGRGNGLVAAEAARLHVLKLRRKGIGYKSVAKAARVPTSTVAKILSGERKQIRAATERRIAAVGMEAARGATVIGAAPTWRLIHELLEEGFTKTSLAQRLGYKRSLQFRDDAIAARNARKVKQLYQTLMVGG